MPGFTAGNSKFPSSADVLTVEIPVSIAVNVTFAPGTTDSDASRTVPTTVAVSNWADALAAVSNSAPTPNARDRMVEHLT